MIITLVVAHARNGVIGVDNRLPWHLPADLKHFKQVTLGKPVVMGRNTFDSIGRPLPGRRNLVVTRNAQWQHEGVEAVGSVEQALALCADEPEVCIIGGAQLYSSAMPLANHAWITEVQVDVDVTGHAAAHFTGFDAAAWQEIARREDRSGPIAFDVVEYRRAG
ncbi:dihydrofolate reductase [soil metagenome]